MVDAIAIGSELWRIRLLGELRATRGDVAIERFRTQKTAALLAYLAYHRERSHPREQLIEMLWPEGKPEAGRNSLSHALSSLRHQLEPPGVASGSVLVASRTKVQLNPAAATTDVLELRTALDLAAQRKGSERVHALEAAVALCLGELCPGLYQDWIVPERARLRAAFVGAARELASERQRGRDTPGALDLLRRAVAADPLGEEARRDLMALLAASGEPGQALREAAELTRDLERELGSTPSPATRELARQIERAVAQDTAPASSRPAPPASVLAPVPASAREPAVPASAPPSGTVTFLLVRGPEEGGAPPRALLGKLGGHALELEPSLLAHAFARPSDALACAVAIPEPGAWRIALDTREVEPEGADAYPPRALARPLALLAAARPGQTLCSEECAALLRRELDGARELVDLGVFRLAGASSPERLFVLARPGAPAPEPPRGEPVHRGRVPLELSRFFGREAELASARETLLVQGARLLTITGPGGVGKTRLAVELQRSLFLDVAGAAWFVPLADVRDASGLAPAVAAALRLELPASREPLEVVALALGKAPSLLVLDNLEQIAAAAASFVAALLERLPALTCVATSRQRLGLESERELALAPLPVPEAEGTPESLARSPSVRLFVDRARAARPDFQITRANATAVAELVRRLEGIPLAIALAGARLQVLSPEQVLARLASPLDLLAGRHRDLPPRHRTLRAAVEGSTELLSPELRLLFARLSVFRGGFTLDAVEAVCDEPLALDRLVDLRESSLVVAVGDDDVPRFRLLEVLRAFGAEQLTPDEGRALRRRHAEFFASFAESVERKLTGPEQPQWFARLASEQENLRAALEECAADPEGASLGLRIAAALVVFWHVRGPASEGRRFLEAALARAPEPTALRAWALSGAGILAFVQADFPAAAALQDESIAVSRQLGDRKAIGRAQANRAMVAFSTGDLASALAAFQEAALVASELGLDGMAASIYHNMGHISMDLGEASRARAELERSRDLYRKLGDRAGAASTLYAQGELERAAADPERARAFFEEALADFRAVGFHPRVAGTLCALGAIHEDAGELDEARPLYEDSLALERATGGRIESVLVNLGRLARREGALDSARELVEESERRCREVGDGSTLARALKVKAEVLTSLGDRAAARAAILESIEIARGRGEAISIPARLEVLARLSLDAGEVAEAARLLGVAATLREQLGTPLTPVERPGLAALVDAAREAGGSAFDPAWQSGLALAKRAAGTSPEPHPKRRISRDFLGALLNDLVRGS